jgi:hypothetical protein
MSMSGNTDCYQPLERQYKITRGLLEVFLKYRHPVGIITKNALILRDIDLLAELASMQLLHVFISITTLDEELRRTMEPRTSSSENRLKTIRTLTDHGIPVGVMTAPIIPRAQQRRNSGSPQSSRGSWRNNSGLYHGATQWRRERHLLRLAAKKPTRCREESMEPYPACTRRISQ